MSQDGIRRQAFDLQRSTDAYRVVRGGLWLPITLNHVPRFTASRQVRPAPSRYGPAAGRGGMTDQTAMG